MNEIEHLRAWSYRRQHLDRSAESPLAALERVLAVHSTHPPAPLSLLARTPGFDYDAFEAIERDKLAVSFPVMRGSVHLLPTAFAPSMFAATSAKFDQLIKRAGTDPGDSRTFDELRVALLARLGEPVEGARIRETLGISEREFLAIRLMTRTGEVLRLSKNPRSDRLLYVATSAWLGAPLQKIDSGTARRWLGESYFSAFGPARLKDFAWWFSASQKNARAAIADLDTVDVGNGLLLPKNLEAEYRGSDELDPHSIAVIPKWDSYTMGYAPDGRQRFIHDEHLAHAYTTSETKVGATSGDGLPLILRGGRAIASWQHRFSGSRMTVTLQPFPGESVETREFNERFTEIGELMGCTAVDVSN